LTGRQLGSQYEDKEAHTRKKSNTVGFVSKENKTKDASTSTCERRGQRDITVAVLKEVSTNSHNLFLDSSKECRRNSLEASFKKLFLSQISEDPESDVYDSKKNLD
jgi:hypothetical protein